VGLPLKGVTDKKNAEKVPFYINRSYAFLWGGQAISNLGDLIFDTTLTLWVATVVAKGQPWAPLAAGGVVLCASIPTFFVGPLAGVFIDRWDKRRTMIRMDIIRAVLIAFLILIAMPLPFMSGNTLPAVWQIAIIYVVIALTTSCSLFFGPARLTIIQNVVDGSQLERASGLALLTQNLSRIIGPSLAAPLLFVFGIQWALLINALSFLVSAYAVKWVQTFEVSAQTQAAKQRPRGNFWHELREGFLFLFKNRVVMVILVALSFTIIGDAAEQTLGVFFLLYNVHVPTALYGIVGTVGGMGGIIGALLATLVVKRIGAVRSFGLGIAGFGLILFLFSRMTSFIPALVCIFLVGMPVACANVVMGPLLLRAIPRELLGRVIAVFTTLTSLIGIVAIGVVTILASALDGFHASLFGMTFGQYDIIFTGCGILTLLVGLGAGVALRGASVSPAQQESPQLETLKLETLKLKTLKLETLQLETLKLDISQLETLQQEISQLETLQQDISQLETLQKQTTYISTRWSRDMPLY
jgi:MFS family permease